jgi:hypothetical protein
MAEVVEHLASKHKAMSLNPSTGVLGVCVCVCVCSARNIT